MAQAKTKYFVIADPWDPLVWEFATLKEARADYNTKLTEGYYSDVYLTRVVNYNQAEVS